MSSATAAPTRATAEMSVALNGEENPPPLSATGGMTNGPVGVDPLASRGDDDDEDDDDADCCGSALLPFCTQHTQCGGETPGCGQQRSSAPRAWLDAAAAVVLQAAVVGAMVRIRKHDGPACAPSAAARRGMAAARGGGACDAVGARVSVSQHGWGSRALSVSQRGVVASGKMRATTRGCAVCACGGAGRAL